MGSGLENLLIQDLAPLFFYKEENNENIRRHKQPIQTAAGVQPVPLMRTLVGS
jgi:hypothetical protein